MRRGAFLIVSSLCLAVAACSGDNRPFEVVYTSRNEAIVTYQGKEYRLNRFKGGMSVPFRYAFESDGDLNLVVDGQEYEIESPFDIDNKKKKKKPSVKKKTK